MLAALTVRSFLTLFLAMAILFSGAHASAAVHEHHDAHADHSVAQPDNQNGDFGNALSGESEGSEQLPHSHGALGAAPDGPDTHGFRTLASELIPPYAAQALASLAIPPPLEPPSA